MNAGSSVTVAAGSKTATLSIHTLGVQQNTAVAISVTINGQTVQSQVTLVLGYVSQLTVKSATLTGGASTTGEVILDFLAQPTGTMVHLASSDPSVQVPATVLIASNKSSAVYTINTSTVTVAKTVTVTAQFNGASKTVTLQLTP